LKDIAYVAIAAAGEKGETLSTDTIVLLRARQVMQWLREGDTIELGRGRWQRLFLVRRCVSGKVRACRRLWPRLDAVGANLPAPAVYLGAICSPCGRCPQPSGRLTSSRAHTSAPCSRAAPPSLSAPAFCSR
jgi:hypothetical protein